MSSDPEFDRRSVMKLSAGLAGMAASQFPMSMAEAQSTPPTVSASRVSIAAYIAIRLRELGCQTLFGVPGATCDPMFESAGARGMRIVVTASDLEAGYAADAYARSRGLGAVCVTYGVGTLSLANAIAGAYAERSPLVLINGGPSTDDLKTLERENTLFSHSLGIVPPRKPGQTTVQDTDMLGDLSVFRRMTAQAVRVTSAADAPRLIDAALSTASIEQRPVYIEVAKSLWESSVPTPSSRLSPSLPSSGQEGAIATRIINSLRSAEKPLLVVGEQIARYRLIDGVTQLLTKLRIPFVTTYLGKAVVSEQHAMFSGVHDGRNATPSTRKLVSEAKCILALGCTFGRQHRDLVQHKRSVLLQVADGQFTAGAEASVAANLGRVIAAMNAAPWVANAAHSEGRTLTGRTFSDRRIGQTQATGIAGPGLTYDAMMGAIDGFLDASFVTINDTTLSQYPAADLNIRERGGFLCNGVWNAIGYSPAAAVGVGLAEFDRTADPAQARRPMVICGDGGFQMTAQAMSTLARQRIRAIVLIIDNAYYAIEQFVVEATKGIPPTDSRSYFKTAAVPPIDHLKLARWDYVMLARAMGIEMAQKVGTAQELQSALAAAKGAQGPALISVSMNPRSIPSDLLS